MRGFDLAGIACPARAITAHRAITPQRAPDGVPLHYGCRRPEQTTLYRLVQRHTAEFIAYTEAATGGGNDI